MADLSKVKLGNEIYNLKDDFIRENLKLFPIGYIQATAGYETNGFFLYKKDLRYYNIEDNEVYTYNELYNSNTYEKQLIWLHSFDGENDHTELYTLRTNYLSIRLDPISDIGKHYYAWDTNETKFFLDYDNSFDSNNYVLKRRTDNQNNSYLIQNENEYDFGLVIHNAQGCSAGVTASINQVNITGDTSFLGTHIGPSNQVPAWVPTDDTDFTTKQYVDEAVAAVPIGTDWEAAQNEDGYIENKPFYTEELGLTTVLSPTTITLDFDDYEDWAYNYELDIDLEQGITLSAINNPYVITINGVDYELEIMGDSEGSYISGTVNYEGSTGLSIGFNYDDQNNNYILTDICSYYNFLDNCGVGENTISIISNPIIIHKLDSKYLDLESFEGDLQINWGQVQDKPELFPGFQNNNSIYQRNASSSGGQDSFAINRGTQASGVASFASGYNTQAIQQFSHSEGDSTTALGNQSHAEGQGQNTVTLRVTVVSGQTNTYQLNNHGLKVGDVLKTQSSLPEYVYVRDIISDSQFVLSRNVGNSGTITLKKVKGIAYGISSHSEGQDTTALGLGSHSEGYDTQASGQFSHTEGKETIANGTYAHAEGQDTQANGAYSHAEGQDTLTRSPSSHAEGASTIAFSQGSHTEGYQTHAFGAYSHAEGNDMISCGMYSHAEGYGNKVLKNYTLSSIGSITYTTSTNHDLQVGDVIFCNNRLAEINTIDSPTQFTIAAGLSDDGLEVASLGTFTNAPLYLVITGISQGFASHAEGNQTRSIGNYSHSEGNNTITTHRSQHVLGEYNIKDSSTQSPASRGNYVEIVGNGTTATRSNARTLDWNGNEILAGKLTVGADPVNNMDVVTKQYLESMPTASLATETTDGLLSADDKRLLNSLNPNIAKTISNLNASEFGIINAKNENALGLVMAVEPTISQQIRTINLLDVNSYTPNFYIGSNGQLASNTNDHVGDFIPVSPGDDIYYTGIIGPTNSGSINRRLHVYTANQTWIKQLSFASSLKVGDSWSTHGVVPANGAYVRVSWGVEDTNVMITVGAPDKYYPYYMTPFTATSSVNFKVGHTNDPEDAITYTFNVPAAAGSLYGLEFDPIKGKLWKVTGHIASYNGETLPGHWQSDRDTYLEGTTPQTGAEVVYRLADEDIVEYDCTPMVIPLNYHENYFFIENGMFIELSYYAATLAVDHLTIYSGATFGETNILETNVIGWNKAAELIDTKADLVGAQLTGNVTAPTLGIAANSDRIATTAFVQSMLHTLAPFETTAKASKNYEVGEYLTHAGNLYKVTAAIAKNANLTVGTNIEATDVATELNLLRSLIQS